MCVIEIEEGSGRNVGAVTGGRSQAARSSRRPADTPGARPRRNGRRRREGKEGREGRRKGSSGAGRRGQARRSGPARPHKPSAGVGEGDSLRDPFPGRQRGGEAAAGRAAEGRPRARQAPGRGAFLGKTLNCAANRAYVNAGCNMVVLPLSSQPVAVGHGTWHQHSGLCGRPATASALSFH